MTDALSEFKTGFGRLGLKNHPVIVHASLRAFGQVDAETMLKALLCSTQGLIMPAFTYKTMLNPEVGPPRNGITYGSQSDLNRMAEPFHAGMPVDRSLGILPEVLRRSPGAKRSSHPIQSFAGINADAVIDAQTLSDPFGPIALLAEEDGWVLLLGVDHTVNTSIHYAEKLAGRRQFMRWALMGDRVVECPGFPGDSEGFNAVAAAVERYSRRVEINGGMVQAVHLRSLFGIVVDLIKKDPCTLLCAREDCERCNAVRQA